MEEFPLSGTASSGRAIADGYQLLNELGAVDDANELTPVGELSAAAGPARGPHDPGGALRQALDEVLVIASALSGAGRARPPLEAAAGRYGARQV